LLLPGSAKLRYTPDGSSVETATIAYRAWDATTGTSGGYADTTANGAATAFSSAADSARLTVASGSVSGYVYVDANNNGQKAGSESGLAGVTVRLTDPNGSVNWTQTDSTGLYSFQCLAAGTYQIQVVPSSKLLLGRNTLGTVAGTSRGTVGQNAFQLSLGAGETGTGYNFAVLGLQPALVSLRLFLASTPPMAKVIQNTYTAPTVNLSGANTTSSFATTYVSGSAAVPIASSSASISSSDSPTLKSATVSIQNIADGGSEQLQATTAGTSITSNYANGVLVLSGVADVSTYQTVLRSITYCNTATPPTAKVRNLSVVVNDGVANSAAVAATVAVKRLAPSGYSIVADTATLDATTATSAGFTFANAEVGATYSYTVSSDQGGTPVTGSGTITSATQNVTGINVSSLADGLLTFTVSLADALGDVGVNVTTTATLQRT
jgi:hypothetical protein